MIMLLEVFVAINHRFDVNYSINLVLCSHLFYSFERLVA